MDFKKGQTIYVKCTVGIGHISGYKGVINRLNKKDGELYSIGCDVSAALSVNYGFEKQNKKQSYRVGIPAYEFFTDRGSFINSMNHGFRNMISVIETTNNELNNF